MNDLSALLAHMGRCCPNDDAARRRASAPPLVAAAPRGRRRAFAARGPDAAAADRVRRGQRLDVLRLRPLGPELSRAPGLDAMIGSARRSHPMTERIDVFCRSMSGLSVKWGGTESLLSLERNVKTHGNVYGLRGGAGSSDLDDRQQPTLQTIAATNDVLVPPGTHRNSRLALQPYSGSYPDGIMRAYEAVSDAWRRADAGAAGDGAADALTADDAALDPAAAMETLMAGRQMVSGVDFSHLVLVGTNLSFPVAKHFTPPKGGGKAADLRHIGRAWSPALVCNRCRGTRWADDCVSSRLCATGECVYRPPTAARCATDAPCDECRALGHTTANGRLACRRSLEAKAQCRRFAVLVVTADGALGRRQRLQRIRRGVRRRLGPAAAEALISAAPGLREFLRAERPLCLVDFVHSLRRIWGKSQDYFLPRATSSPRRTCSWLCGASARPHEWVKHLSTKALRAKNRLCSQSVKDLRHNLVRSPCALACATKSTLVFVVTREGSVLAVTNKQPATVSLVAGRALATTPATAVPKKASTKRSAPGALALVNPTGVAMFDNDRYLVVADFGQPAALIVVEYPRRVDAYRAHVHRRPFREAVAAMTAAIESIVADMDVMGAAISRSGGVNATKGPDATPSSATVRAMLAQLLLLDDAFAELVCGGETGLTAAQLDASTSMLDVVTTHAERFNAQQRQAQVNSSAAELGTAADVVALEPRAIEDALQNGSRTTWDTRKPGDGKTFYVTPEGGKAVPWEDVDAIAPRPEGGRENAVLERCDGMDDGAAALRFACSDGAARDGGHADGHGPRDRARAGPGRGRLGSGLGVL
ncbi:hypothetical protein JL720_5759 [Aureococcus anophagefferens]|nr:hypothetical protein JL720_5759 [Aureococcus anophagefferens]